MMPANVLILGNSHISAPRAALVTQPERWPGFDAATFGMPGGSLRHLDLKGRDLVPRDAQTRRVMRFFNHVTRLPLAGYDGFVVVGGLSFASLISLVLDHRSLDFPSVQAGASCDLISAGLVQAMVRQRIEGSVAMQVVRLLHRLDQGPVLFLPEPLVSADCRSDPDAQDMTLAMARTGDGGHFRQQVLRQMRQHFAGFATLLEQPQDSIVDEIFTDGALMRGSIRMTFRDEVPHEGTDYAHANAAFGAMQLDQIVQAFAAL